MCEGDEGKQKDEKVKKQGEYCSQNRDSKRTGKLIRDAAREEPGERKLIKHKNLNEGKSPQRSITKLRRKKRRSLCAAMRDLLYNSTLSDQVNKKYL